MRKILYWSIAVIITVVSVVYQRATGPTNPKKYIFTLCGKEYDIKLVRSLDTDITLEEAKDDYVGLGKMIPMEVSVKEASDSLSMTLFYRRYPSDDTISIVKAIRAGDIFTVMLPSQPPAGKLEYFVEFSDSGKHCSIGYEDNLTIRFKNPVPIWALLPHIFLMFIAILLSTYLGVISFDRKQNTRVSIILLLTSLIAGGLIFGPVVQKYAFGEFWTGWPFGNDMTDNKTLMALIVWLTAIWGNRRNDKRWWYAVAAIFMLFIYSIPHSASGSEYDYSKKRVVTGEILNTYVNPERSEPHC
ncbi:MAG: hypothetical protein VB022_05885 [Rikenellaceae bacterium]|nr:hypothetical protein [Rikenellaceae bacterium]